MNLSHPFFDSLNDDERRWLLDRARTQEVAAGEIFAREHEPADTFFMILTGTVQVSKYAKSGHVHVISESNAGEILGETALVEHLPRPTTFTATEPTALLVFDVALIQAHEELYRKFTIALTKRLSKRLRELKTMTVESMQHKLEEYKKRILLGTFLVMAIYMTAIYTLSLAFIQDLKKYLSTTTGISVIIVFMTVSVIAWQIKKYKLPLKMFGLTTENWQKNIIEAVAFSLVFIAGFTLLKWIIIRTLFRAQAMPLFDPTSIFLVHAVFSWRVYFFSLVFYIIFVPLQEFIVRGTLQSTFYHYMAGSERKRTWTAILISNLLFAIVHLHPSPFLPFLVFIPGLFWGWLFARQKSLIGVSISHILIGVWVIFISGFSKGIL